MNNDDAKLVFRLCLTAVFKKLITIFIESKYNKFI